MAGKPERIQSNVVQASRGVAAALVVFYHAAAMFALPKYGGRAVWDHWGEVFKHGVDFFFVLSGFIIVIAHQHDVGRPCRLKRYLLRRFTRIYPTYWVILTGFLLLVAIGLNNAPVARSPVDLLSAYSLIRLSPEKPPLWVAWTLFHEIMFYLVFAMVIYSKKLGAAAFGVWLIAILAMHRTGEGVATVASVFYDAINLEFFMGMLVAFYIRSIGLGQAKALLAAGVVLLVGVGVVDHNTGFRYSMLTLGYGLSSALIIAGLVALELHRKVSAPKVLQMLGTATFSIYLCHGVLISIIYRFVSPYTPSAGISGELVPVLVGLAVIPIAALAYVVIERPVTDWVRHFTTARQETALSAA